MDHSRIDEQKLINTLKGILKQFISSEQIPMETQVKRYLEIKMKNLSPVHNSDNSGIFYFKNGQSKFFFNKRTKNLSYSSQDLFNLMNMFKIDEDIAEEILKRWFQSKFGLDVNYMYNQ